MVRIGNNLFKCLLYNSLYAYPIYRLLTCLMSVKNNIEMISRLSVSAAKREIT